jgi:hypothetical protein
MQIEGFSLMDDQLEGSHRIRLCSLRFGFGFGFEYLNCSFFYILLIGNNKIKFRIVK